MWRLWSPLLLLSALLPVIVLVMPLVERHLIDEVILGGQLAGLPITLLTYGGLWLLSSVCGIAGAVLRTALSEQITLRLRERLFAQCTHLSIAFARQEHSGQTISLFVNDVPIVASALSTTIAVAVSSLVGIGVGVALMLSLNWQLAVVAGVAPPAIAALAAVLTRPLRPAANRAQAMAAELNARLQENLAGLREIVAFGQEQARAGGVVAALRELVRVRMRIAFFETTLGAGQSILSLAVTLAILGFGGYLVILGVTTLGTLVAMQSLFGYVFQPAMQATGTISALQKALGAADRIYAFLDQRPTVRERRHARPPRAVSGAITFQDVTFEYEPGRPVVRGLTLAVGAGEQVAIVGPSGAGKSTLVNLLARFYDPTAGVISLDGTDLRDLTLEGLRRQIGFVFQDTFLFAGTIRENVAFGRLGASEPEIEAALKAAQAWEFVEQLTSGLDTFVGERGVRLSEGQKQRLAIARALLRDPRILILDEPTSALDARSDHLVQAALDVLVRGRTTFTVAHRLGTVQRADRIIVLDHGQLVEAGSHAELSQQNGLYRELLHLQFGVRDSAVVGSR